MLIDCDNCAVRGAACAGCAVTALLDPSQDVGELTPDEVGAIELLARAGLEPQVLAAPRQTAPLRLVPRPRRRRRVA
ncbi:hypothetical protein SAMN05444365_105114 [Micromonospora pattaloongensis]|uniref:Uncharacterized protein n=1 Tax=Micromonospora pattaloongensis TaxID=405436 RepID=A0A1H3PY31_9ACTN|nr:hypothetical protein [Micromonospora pattaloongensis]SDZ06202.1 hypothetical protein SAMN05444365_105114 [Micromonospora pattaloongensis]